MLFRSGARLREIQTFAESFCGSEPRTSQDTSGERRRYELSVTADAKLGELMRTLSGVGVNGAAKYGVEQYRGVLQDDIAKELASRRECRFNVFDRLISFLGIERNQEVQFTTTGKVNSATGNNKPPCESNEFESNGIRVCLINLKDSGGWGLSKDAISVLRVTAADEPPIEVTVREGDKIDLRTYTCKRISIDDFSVSTSGGFERNPDGFGFRARKASKSKDGTYECGFNRAQCYVYFKISAQCKPIR